MQDIPEETRMDDKRLDGVVIFSGTIPLLHEKPHFGSSFEVDLYNPGNGRNLNCSYKVNVLNYLKGQNR